MNVVPGDEGQTAGSNIFPQSAGAEPEALTESKNREFLDLYRSKSLFVKLPRNSLARNLRATFIRLGVILVLVGTIGTGALVYSNTATSDLLNHLQPLITYNNNMLIDVLDMNTDVRNYIRTGEAQWTNSYNKNKQTYQNSFAQVLRLESPSEVSAGYFKAQNSAALKLFNTFEQSALSTSPSQLTSQGANEILVSISQSLAQFETQYNITNLHLLQEQSSEHNHLKMVLLLTTIATVLIILLSLIIGFRRAIATRSSVQRLLSRLTSTLSKLEAGENNVRAPMTGLEEEQILAKAINSMASQKESLMAELEQRFVREKELREGLELEESLREGLTQTLYRDHDVATAIQRTVNGFGPALHADRALVRLLEGGRPGSVISEWHVASLTMSLADNVNSSSLGSARRALFAQPGFVGEALQRGSVVTIDDVANDARLTEDLRKTVSATGLGSFLIAPVMGANGPQAALIAVMEGKTRNWNDRDVQVAKTMAVGLAATLTAIQLYEQERKALAAVKQLDESKNMFLASVSHELRTPLSSIVGYLELLEDAVTQKEIPRNFSYMIDAIHRNSQRLLDLIENILTASSIESGALQLTKTRIHLTSILMRAAEAVMPQVSAKRIDLKMHMGEGIPDLDLDAKHLERAILNILSNAIKFTPEGGIISVDVAADNNCVTISISDTGMGIAEDEMERLFTKFYRTSAARDNAVQGTGLGLMIVKAIVEAHGGRVAVFSKVGKGTTFQLILPKI